MARDFYEDSKFYKRLPAGKTLTKQDLLLVVVGETLSGKTALVNALEYPCVTQGTWTGSTVPRVAVEVESGEHTVRVLDMPGNHGVNVAEIEELVRRTALSYQSQVAILCVVSGDALARTLPFVLELTELNVPLIVGLRDFKRAQDERRLPNLDVLSHVLGLPIFTDLGEHCLNVHKLAPLALSTVPPSFTLRYNPAVEKSLREVVREIPANTARWLSVAAVQGQQVSLPDEAQVKATQQNLLWRESGLDFSDLVLCTRQQLAQGLAAEATKRRRDNGALSQALGKSLAHPVLGILAFLVAAVLLLHLAFGLAYPWMRWINLLASLVGGQLQAWEMPDFCHSFLSRGLVAGLGGFAAFIPLLFAFYAVLIFLDEVGLTARAELGLSALSRKLGVAESSFSVLFRSLGCSITGAESASSLPTPGNQLRAALAAPLLPCAGKLGVMACLAAILCPEHAALTLVGLYAFALVFAVLALAVSKPLEKKVAGIDSEELEPELPPVCWPELRPWLRAAWNMTWNFVVVAFIPVLVVIILFWGMAFTHTAETVSGWFAWFFRPLALGEWRAVSALLAGLLAKEAMLGAAALGYLVNDPSPLLSWAEAGSALLLGTQEALWGMVQALTGFFSWDALQTCAQVVPLQLARKMVPLFSPSQSLALLVFVAYCPPCLAFFMSALRRLGGKYALIQGAVQLALAWVLTLIVSHM